MKTTVNALRIVLTGPRTIALSGELDLAVARSLVETLEPVTAQPGPLTIDLSDLRFMDVAGYRAIRKLAASMRGGPLVLLHANGAVARLLEIVEAVLAGNIVLAA